MLKNEANFDNWEVGKDYEKNLGEKDGNVQNCEMLKILRANGLKMKSNNGQYSYKCKHKDKV